MYISKKRAVLVVLTIVVFVTALYFTYTPEECGSFECFQEKMSRCDWANYINEEPEASWRYDVLGPTEEGDCEVKVTLLAAKMGDLSIGDFQGNYMSCFYPLGTSAYPDKDLSLCHGRLKEDLQGRIITKLHEYFLDNLIEVEAEYREAIESAISESSASGQNSTV